MLKGVNRSIAGILAWAAIMLVTASGWGQSDGDDDTSPPAAGAPGGSSAGGPSRSSAGGTSAGSEEAEGEDASPPPEREDASGALGGDPYAVDPYERDRPEGDAGIP